MITTRRRRARLSKTVLLLITRGCDQRQMAGLISLSFFSFFAPQQTTTMSNRSTTPIPPPESGSGTLSNNALYAPLSTYVEDNRSSSGKSSSSNNSRHSLSLQTTSSLRESSLITFLTTMSTNLKATSRSSGECCIYRTLGGSIANHGMGDSDRAERSLRSMFESKLSNRSLVLVGGGIHSSMNTTTTTLNNRGHNPNNMTTAAATTTTLMQQTACGKRQRKRVGGNGIFGSISNKRRKRILKNREALLQKVEVERVNEEIRRTKNRDESREQQTIGSPGNVKLDAMLGEDIKQQQRNAQQQQQQQQHQLQQQQMGSFIETIHTKWSIYITQLLTMTMKNDNTNKDITFITTSTAVNERISYLLAKSEHVGMAVTIVNCNSRRHLLNSRCIVIDETKEMWKMSILVATKKKKKKRKNHKEEEIKCNVNNSSKEEKVHNNHGIMSTSWSIIMVPKRGTTLEINVPWNVSYLLSNKSAITSTETMNQIIVRLEN